MPLSLSQEDNVVDNRPLPAKPTGADAVAAFRAGKSSAKKSEAKDASASATKANDSERKKKRKSVAPTSPPRSPAAQPASPPPSGSGRKRKAATVAAAPDPERKYDVDSDEDEEKNESPLSAALTDFVPASLTPLPSGTANQPLWLFQFPAKFDVAAFSALRLSLPSHPPSSAASSRVVTRFQLGGSQYRLVEAEPGEGGDIVNLFPAAAASPAANLAPGRPFARLLRVTLDDQHAATSWQHTSAALKRKTAVPAAKGLTVHFRPIGYMEDGEGQLVGDRRGKDFRKVRYEAEEGQKEKKRRKKDKVGKENDGTVREGEEMSEKKKKKKDKDRKHRDSK